MRNLYRKEVFDAMIHNYKCIIEDKDEDIKAYKLQLEDLKERVNNILMYEKIDRKALEEVQELLELYT